MTHLGMHVDALPRAVSGIFSSKKRAKICVGVSTITQLPFIHCSFLKMLIEVIHGQAGFNEVGLWEPMRSLARASDSRAMQVIEIDTPGCLADEAGSGCGVSLGVQVLQCRCSQPGLKCSGAGSSSKAPSNKCPAASQPERPCLASHCNYSGLESTFIFWVWALGALMLYSTTRAGLTDAVDMPGLHSKFTKRFRPLSHPSTNRLRNWG